MRKIGINLLALPGMTDADYLRAAAELGFEAIFTGMCRSDGAEWA